MHAFIFRGSFLLPLSYFLLAWGMYRGNGMYEEMGFALTAMSFAVLLLWVFIARAQKRVTLCNVPMLLLCLYGLLIIGALHRPWYYVDFWEPSFQKTVSWFVLLILLPLWYKYRHNRSWQLPVFLCIVAAAITLHVWMMLGASPPLIDVYSTIQESSAAMLEGSNPYSTPIANTNPNGIDYGYKITGYMYLPTNLYFHVTGFALTGDARWIHILAVLIFSGCLWLFAKKHHSAPVADLLVLMLLFHPRELFVLRHAWTEPLILLLLGVFILLKDRNLDRSASAAYGVMLSLKQYLLFFVFHWLLIERRWKMLAIGMGAGLLTVVPFLIANPESFFENAVWFQLFEIPFRRDALSLGSYLSHAHGIEIGSTAIFIAGILSAILSVLLLRKLPGWQAYLSVVTITTFAMFFLGVRAYANYYYFVTGLMLLLMASTSPIARIESKNSHLTEERIYS